MDARKVNVQECLDEGIQRKALIKQNDRFRRFICLLCQGIDAVVKQSDTCTQDDIDKLLGICEKARLELE